MCRTRQRLPPSPRWPAAKWTSCLCIPGRPRRLYDSGRVRPLAIGAPARIRTLPQLPTLLEEGIANYQITSWFATYFVNKTSPDKAKAMRAILTKAVKSPTYLEPLAKAGLEPFELAGEEITALTRTEIDQWGRILRAPNVRQTN